MPVKVLIVEDMATYRTIISRSIAEIPGVEVVGKASNGRKALDFLAHNEVDLITLDVEMPIMDGLATLKDLRQRGDTTDVVMLSGLSDQAAQLTIQCLELGAIDFVLKPQTSSFVQNQNQLVENLKGIIANLERNRKFRKKKRPVPTQTRVAEPKPIKKAPEKPVRRHPPRHVSMLRPKILLIGISTGGPKALAEVFENLKGPLPFSILIVQHMPPTFTKSLAQSLNKKGSIEVVEAMDGDVIQPNTAYIAKGGMHLCLEKEEDFGLVLTMNQDNPVNSCRPSVDVLFKSVAPLFKKNEVIAIVMTGMGRDGADGCVPLRDAGAYIVSQSEESCTIYGMPKSVEDEHLQDEVLDLSEIAPFIDRMGKNPFGPR